MNANAQILLDHLTAAATPLTGVAWIDLHDTTPGAFCLVRGEGYKLTPCRVCDGFGETVILEHPAYVQVFKYDDSKSVDQLAALLMSKVAALVGDAFVYTSNHFATLAALRRAFLGRAQFTIRSCQLPFLDSKESWIRDGFASRKRGEAADTYIYARHRRGDGQRLMLAFGREAGKPLARRASRDGERFNKLAKKSPDFRQGMNLPLPESPRRGEGSYGFPLCCVESL